MHKEILTFKEFIAYLGISKSLGYKLTSSKRIPHFKPTNGKLFFKKSDVDHFISQNRVESIEDIKGKSKIDV